jgi:hypothetical protein
LLIANGGDGSSKTSSALPVLITTGATSSSVSSSTPSSRIRIIGASLYQTRRNHSAWLGATHQVTDGFQTTNYVQNRPSLWNKSISASPTKLPQDLPEERLLHGS